MIDDKYKTQFIKYLRDTANAIESDERAIVEVKFNQTRVDMWYGPDFEETIEIRTLPIKLPLGREPIPNYGVKSIHDSY